MKTRRELTVQDISSDERRFFRDLIRRSRAAALLDAEGFRPIVLGFEQLGARLRPDDKGLGRFGDALKSIASMASCAPCDNDDRQTFIPVPVLFEFVKNGRNDAVHEGAYARHLVRHCIEFALLVEEGLMVDAKVVADFMVRDPTCVEPWNQVAVARQRMLTNSFSHLPIWINNSWNLLTDHAVAHYLTGPLKRQQALRRQISEAVHEGLKLDPAILVTPATTVHQVIESCDGRPVLVVEGERLVGIATPFDFL